MARKGKYRDAAPIILRKIEEGYTNNEAMRFAGVSHDAFYKWMRTKAEFADLVKKARENFMEKRQGELEQSLMARAMGTTKVEEITSEYMAGADGKPVLVKQVRKEKTVPPDTAALIFALTNAAPDKWRNRQNNEVTGKDGERLLAPLVVEVIDSRDKVDTGQDDNQD